MRFFPKKLSFFNFHTTTKIGYTTIKFLSEMNKIFSLKLASIPINFHLKLIQFLAARFFQKSHLHPLPAIAPTPKQLRGSLYT